MPPPILSAEDSSTETPADPRKAPDQHFQRPAWRIRAHSQRGDMDRLRACESHGGDVGIWESFRVRGTVVHDSARAGLKLQQKLQEIVSSRIWQDDVIKSEASPRVKPWLPLNSSIRKCFQVVATLAQVYGQWTSGGGAAQALSSGQLSLLTFSLLLYVADGRERPLQRNSRHSQGLRAHRDSKTSTSQSLRRLEPSIRKPLPCERF